MTVVLEILASQTLPLLTLFAIVLFVLGVRILLVFGTWAIGYALTHALFPPINMAIIAYESLNTFAWVAIPLFVIVGSLIGEFGISEDIVDFTNAIAGWLPGTIGNTAIYTAGVFSAITGSNEATTASVGEALYDELLDEGYSPNFAAATIASGGTVGIIIPPSVLFILYGVTFNVSVPALFQAGIVPGIAMLLVLSAYTSYTAYTNDYGVGDYDFEPLGILRATWKAKHAFITVALLVGGVLGGLFTPPESAGIAFAYIVVTGLATGRFTDVSQVVSSLKQGVTLTGITVPLYVTSVMVQQSLSYEGIQEVVANVITGLPTEWLVIAAMVGLMLFTGSVLASLPNMIITAPLLAPVATETLGMHPITWGVVFMMSDAIGFITPPYGLNLFVISEMTGQEYMRVARAAVPYLLLLIGVWLTFFLFPNLNVLSPV
ncbi:MAG: TRAP transporter large permease [Halanaeroarchaeum sp.]